jgi:hypothetical protein
MPAALRAWELVAIFQQAERAWLTLMDAIASGYSSAWDKQVSVLSDIQRKIQKDSDRACFILSVLTAGIGGGVDFLEGEMDLDTTEDLERSTGLRGEPEKC